MKPCLIWNDSTLTLNGVSKAYVTQLAGLDASRVLVGPHLGGVRRVVVQSSAEHDAAEVLLATQVEAGLVEQGADPASAVVGMYVDVGAIERVAERVVVVEHPVVGDAVPGMGAVGLTTEAHDERCARPDDAPAVPNIS